MTRTQGNRNRSNYSAQQSSNKFAPHLPLTRPVFSPCCYRSLGFPCYLGIIGRVTAILSRAFTAPTPPYRGHPIKIWGYTATIRIWPRHYAQLRGNWHCTPMHRFPGGGKPTKGPRSSVSWWGPIHRYFSVSCVGIFWRRIRASKIRAPCIREILIMYSRLATNTDSFSLPTLSHIFSKSSTKINLAIIYIYIFLLTQIFYFLVIVKSMKL